MTQYSCLVKASCGGIEEVSLLNDSSDTSDGSDTSDL